MILYSNNEHRRKNTIHPLRPGAVWIIIQADCAEKGGIGLNPMYTCECADGKTITGCSRWGVTELKQMQPLELAQVLMELRDFSRYYESTFFYPIQALQTEINRLEQKYRRCKYAAVFCGTMAAAFTLLWLILFALPVLRFSGLTIALAVLTLISIVVLIPFLFRYVSTQEDYAKRLPRFRSKLEQLRQQEEKEIYGTYVEYLIGGYLISPEFSLSDQALELMIRALSSRRASNLSEAAMLCKRKFGKSPVPRIITSLRSVTDPDSSPRASQAAPTQRLTLNQLENQGPDLQVVLQLSEYLSAALKGYAANQPASSQGGDSIAATLTCEEEQLIAEYRYLQEDEKKRIRRVVHSFHTKKY